MSTFTVEVTNHGSVNARNLLLRVDLPLNTSVIKSSETPPIKPRTPMTTPVPYGNSLYWTVAPVDAKSTRKFQLSYLVNDGVEGQKYIAVSLFNKANVYCDQMGPTVPVSGRCVCKICEKDVCRWRESLCNSRLDQYLMCAMYFHLQVYIENGKKSSSITSPPSSVPPVLPPLGTCENPIDLILTEGLYTTGNVQTSTVSTAAFSSTTCKAFNIMYNVTMTTFTPTYTANFTIGSCFGPELRFAVARACPAGSGSSEVINAEDVMWCLSLVDFSGCGFPLPTVELQAGVSYTVMLGFGEEWNKPAKAYRIDPVLLDYPYNELCTDAPTLQLGANPFVLQATGAYLADVNTICSYAIAYYIYNANYFTFTPATTDYYTFSTCDTVDFDSMIWVMSSCDPETSLLNCNDDCFTDVPYVGGSAIDWRLTAGKKYYVVVGAYNPYVLGSGILTVSKGSLYAVPEDGGPISSTFQPPPPPYDGCWYIVEEGDTCEMIADKYWFLSVMQLQMYNEDIIIGAECVVEAGQRLYVCPWDDGKGMPDRLLMKPQERRGRRLMTEEVNSRKTLGSSSTSHISKNNRRLSVEI